jgi:hypothetical protein
VKTLHDVGRGGGDAVLVSSLAGFQTGRLRRVDRHEHHKQWTRAATAITKQRVVFLLSTGVCLRWRTSRRLYAGTKFKEPPPPPVPEVEEGFVFGGGRGPDEE